MTNPEDFLAGSSPENEKLERFESSTIEKVLKQLGAEPGYIREKNRQYGMGLTCEWFNLQQFIMPTLYTSRFFNFNFTDLFLRPSKHDITHAVLELKEHHTPDPYVLVFKVYDIGRMIATNCIPKNKTYMHIPCTTHPFYVCRFDEFFTDQFGTPIEREL